MFSASTRLGRPITTGGRAARSSAVIAARLARDAVRLALLMRKNYPPYAKWLGTAFARLPGVSVLHGELTRAVTAATWPERERALSAAYSELARWHNELGLTEPIDAAVRRFYDRPYQVIGAERISAALRESIGSDVLRELPPIGAADQFIDSTDAANRPELRRAAVKTFFNRHCAT